MKTINLFDHNRKAYKKIVDAYSSGKQIVGIRHATGTGKSYIALNLVANNEDKKCLWVVPSIPIRDHILEIIKKEGYTKEDFDNLEIITYHQLQYNSKKDNYPNYDLLILDEFHHIGAPLWGRAINSLVEKNKNKKVFGMSAYTIRGRGTRYERDITLENSDELFSNAIVSEYDIADAIFDGLLPPPIYRTAYFELENEINEIINELNDIDKKTDKDYEDLLSLKELRRQVHNTNQIEKLIKENVLPKSKCIYFCPPRFIEKNNDIDTIMNVMKKYFDKLFPNEKVFFYKTTAKYKDGKANRDAFYNDKDLDGNDVSDSIRIMFAINQYNEGVHTKGVDTVFLGRETESDIIAMEQIGRALSVGNYNNENYEYYSKFSEEELRDIAIKRNIDIMNATNKEELVQKIITPKIIDLACHYELIKELEDNLKFRLKMSNNKSNDILNKTKNSNKYIFNIKLQDENLYKLIKNKKQRIKNINKYKDIKDFLEEINTKKYISTKERNNILKEIIDLKEKYIKETNQEQKSIIQREIIDKKKYLASHYLRIVVKIATKYTDEAYELMELVQEGTLGLMQTIDNIDKIEKIDYFIILMHKNINQKIEKRIIDMNESELPLKTKEIFDKLSEIEKVYKKQSIDPTIELLNDNTKINIDYIKLYKSFIEKKEKKNNANVLYSKKTIQREQELEEINEKKELIKRIILELDNTDYGLNDREKYVIVRYYNLNEEGKTTFNEIGQELNITRERVRQICSKATNKIGNYYKEQTSINKIALPPEEKNENEKKSLEPQEVFNNIILDITNENIKHNIIITPYEKEILEYGCTNNSSTKNELFEKVKESIAKRILFNNFVLSAIDTKKYGMYKKDFIAWLKLEYSLNKNDSKNKQNYVTFDLINRIERINKNVPFENNTTINNQYVDDYAKEYLILQDIYCFYKELYDKGISPKTKRFYELTEYNTKDKQINKEIKSYFEKEKLLNPKKIDYLLSKNYLTTKQKYVTWIEKKYNIDTLNPKTNGKKK